MSRQSITVPIPATQDRLPPRAGIAGHLRAHPTCPALLISEQTFQEQIRIAETLSCMNSGRIRRSLSRGDAAHDAVCAHDLQIMVVMDSKKLYQRQL